MVHFAWPPGPRHPALLQAAWLAYRPFRFLEWCRDTYGDVFTITTPPLGRSPIFSRPDDVAQILALDGDSVLGGAGQAPVVDFAGVRSLMKLDGTLHQQHREILTRALMPSRLPGGGAHLLEQISGAVARWPVGKRFDLGAAIDRLALELVASLGFDGVPPELMITASAAMRSLHRASSPLGLFIRALAPSGRGSFETVRSATEDYIVERARRLEGETPGAGRCLFESLATQVSSTGKRLGSDDLRDELMTVLTAMLGGLTCAVKHAFYWVLRTSGIQARIRGELSAANALQSPDHVTNRPYLDVVCKEVLRLCPDIPFAVRRTVTDIEIGQYRLPAATTIGVGIYLLHRREDSFPEPDRFLPDRFSTTRPSRFEYMPFGGGRRGCVAAPLFVFVEKLILASAIERYHIRLCSRRENPVTSLALVSTPAWPLWVIAERVASRSVTVDIGISLRVEAPHTRCEHKTRQPDHAQAPPGPGHVSAAPRSSVFGTDHECPARGTRQRG